MKIEDKGLAVVVFILALFFVGMIAVGTCGKKRKTEIQIDWAAKYAILQDSFVTYKNDKQGNPVAETKANFLTQEEFEIMQKQQAAELKLQFGRDMAKLVSTLKIVVQYPETKSADPVSLDSLTGAIIFKTVDDSCKTIKAWVDSSLIGHIDYTQKPTELDFTTYWKNGKWFRRDTLVTSGRIVSGCGTITKQKQTVIKPSKNTKVKNGILITIGAAAALAVIKFLGL